MKAMHIYTANSAGSLTVGYDARNAFVVGKITEFFGALEARFGLPFLHNTTIIADAILPNGIAGQVNVLDGAVIMRFCPEFSEKFDGEDLRWTQENLLCHEWGHSLDFVYGTGHGYFSDSPLFRKGGAIHDEARARAASDEAEAEFWSYAFLIPDDAARTAKEIFAELVGLYLMNPALTKEQYPLGGAFIEASIRSVFGNSFKVDRVGRSLNDAATEKQLDAGRVRGPSEEGIHDAEVDETNSDRKADAQDCTEALIF